MQKNLFSVVVLAGFLAPGICLASDYQTNYPPDQKIVDKGRSLNSVSIDSPTFGFQTVEVGQAADGLLYHDKSSLCFVASAGETVTPTFGWTGAWMHGYVYLDRNGDGEFTHSLDADSAIPEGSDVMGFSNYQGFNSAGEVTNNGNVGVNTPSFTVPADLEPGVYRMRYKVDWNSIDPGGNDANGVAHQQLITDNAGAIADVSLYVAAISSALTVKSDHGKLVLPDGSLFSADEFTPGSPVTLTLVGDEGYLPVSLSIVSHLSVEVPDGYTLTSSALKDTNLKVPTLLMTDNTFTIPGDYMRGDVEIVAEFVEGGDEPAEGNYEANVEGIKSPEDGIIAFSVNGSDVEVVADSKHYTISSPVAVIKGDDLKLAVDYKGDAKELRLYIDCDNNGVFSQVHGECMAVTSGAGEFDAISLPSLLPVGVYRARLEAVGDCVVDFLMSYRNEAGNVKYDILNGIALNKRGQALGNSVEYGKEFVFQTKTLLDGFDASTLTVRHGQRLDGPEFIRGNRQWEEITVDANSVVTLTAEEVDGDIIIYGAYEATPESEWAMIWNDEFDGEVIDSDKWAYCDRQSSTWNKRIAVGKEREYVNKVADGSYNSYAIATPAEFAATEKQPIITGAIKSQGKFYLTGGRVEAKIRSRALKGSFPAFWMMPVDGSRGWPACGEIDIWEQIDANPTTYHTIHSGWTYKSYGTVSQSSPKSSGSASANQEEWHVYTLEWDKDEYLKWYKDGRLVFTYENAHFSEGSYTEAVTWPFAKAFYVIINQSVGDGGWAADGDKNYEYLTEFDYVRAYQRKDATNYYSVADGKVTSIIDIVADNEGGDCAPRYYNLQGMPVASESLQPGIYIECRGNKSRKVMIK